MRFRRRFRMEVTKLTDIPRITASPRRPQGGGAMP
jgi:hypothetical protein